MKGFNTEQDHPAAESGNVYDVSDPTKNVDDDGREKRTGTWLTASAHIITAVIGSGVLSLAWAIAQLGWIAGTLILVIFSFITYFTSTMLADCYRAPDPVTGKRNYTYMDVVRSYLGGKVGKTNMTGTVVGVDVTAAQKIWRSFQAVGDIAFAYAYATDTLKSGPAENKSMKRASLVGVSTTTFFYILCGCLGYAAFGNKAPGDFLTDFGFYEPFWLIDFANACIAFHLIGAYQVFAQPIFQFVEKRCNRNWPDNKFITSEYSVNVLFLGKFNISLFRLVWRTAYVVITTVVAMIFPFFNAILGLIGAASFWPLTVYFPVEMHIAQTKVKKYSPRWIGLKMLCWVCLIVSLLAAAGSIAGLISSVKTYKPFRTISC
ncbi:hypothetical protein F2Q69_00036550 [Brassica cretica]|uniref:Amino acid transporter transmembrane domain-containing protein n=1 Tax=Brassica cretica TaxID=69181 RepID=A0A8S9S9B2_BRACR|nr:hypothetical protein F2Q69_00036550 [Brassica cretica]